MWYDSDCSLVSLPIVANNMNARRRSEVSVPVVARCGPCFGQGNVSRSGIGKLTGGVLKENACTLLSPAASNENIWQEWVQPCWTVSKLRNRDWTLEQQ